MRSEFSDLPASSGQHPAWRKQCAIDLTDNNYSLKCYNFSLKSLISKHKSPASSTSSRSDIDIEIADQSNHSKPGLDLGFWKPVD
ncbi:hypothetical protein AUF62_00915 [archaeon 13_1_20CM_52_20]|nr:MAG: hypothetical protein AUF62_00915 [archaeon 13_1_20CM_52_20]